MYGASWVNDFATPDNLQEFLKRGGHFTLSDDSHAVDQVGSALGQVLRFAKKLDIDRLAVFEKGVSTKDARFPGISSREVMLKELGSHKFFTLKT